MPRQLGVGFIGAGPVTHAIHMPVIASLGERLKVVHVMDVDRNVAEVVAARAGARASTDAGRVLEDPDVDIVAVCSPHRFHTDQVLAAVAAGKRAVLCEKPLTTTAEQAERLAGLCQPADVTVVVGAMHAYDPAYVAAQQHLLSSHEPPTLVRSVAYLPGNDEMTDLTPELVSTPAVAGPPDNGPDAERELSLLRGGVLGLAIHDLPHLAERPVGLEVAHSSEGQYVVVGAAGPTAITLTGVISPLRSEHFSLDAVGENCRWSARFAGDAPARPSEVTRWDRSGSRTAPRRYEGSYRRCWRLLHTAIETGTPSQFTLEDLAGRLAAVPALFADDAVVEQLS